METGRKNADKRKGADSEKCISCYQEEKIQFPCGKNTP